MKMATFVQARMTSSRLPGKILRTVGGKPLLLYLIERLRREPTLPPTVILTSDDPTDDPVMSFCEQHGVTVFRGDLLNVAERFSQAARHFGVDAFVRLSGDSPLLDPRLITRALELYQADEPDLVTNVAERTYPKGQSVEILETATFLRACGDFESDADREHVTPWYYRHPDRIRMVGFTHTEDLHAETQVIDTPEEFVGFERLIAHLDRPHTDYTWLELLDLQRELAAVS